MIDPQKITSIPDPTNWTTWGTGTQDESGGTLNQSSSGASGEYAGVSSVNTYDCTNKTVVAQINQLPTNATGSQMYLRVELDANNGIVMGFGDGNLFCQHQLVNVYTTMAAVPWPAGTIGIKLVFDNAQSLLWYASTSDGITWTSRYSESIPFATTALRIILAVGTYQVVASPGTGKWESTGLAVVSYKDLTGTSTSSSTASGVVSRRPIKNIVPSATYPCTGAAMTVGLITSSAFRATSMLIRQVAKAVAYDVSELYVPLEPVAPNSVLIVFYEGGPVPGHANVGTITYQTPAVYKAGVSQGSFNTLRQSSSATGSRIIRTYDIQAQSVLTQLWGVGISVRCFITAGSTVGELRATVVELAGARLTPAGSYYSSLASANNGTASNPYEVPTTGFPLYALGDTGFLIAGMVAGQTTDGFTFVQSGMPGKTWRRVDEENSGTIHMPFVLDTMIGHNQVGDVASLQSRWTSPTGGVVSGLVLLSYRGPTPSLVGTANGSSWTSQARSALAPPRFVGSFLVNTQSNGQTTCVGLLTARLRYADLPVGAPTATFTTDGVLDTGWTFGGTSPGVQSVAAGTLNLSPTASTISDSRIASNSTFNVLNKAVWAEIVAIPSANVSLYSALRLETDATHFVQMGYQNSQLVLQYNAGSGLSGYWNPAYPAGLRAVRLRVEGPLPITGLDYRIYADYTTDGVHWLPIQGDGKMDTVASNRSCINPSAVRIVVTNTAVNPITSPGVAQWDNVNAAFPWVPYKSLTGTSNGAATEAGQVDKAPSRKDIVGLAVGATTVSVLFAARRYLTASSAGVSSVAVTLQRKRSLTVSSAGTSTVSATLQRLRNLTVSSAGIATVSQILTRIRNLVVTSAGAASVTVALRTTRALTGTSNASAVANSAVFIPFGPTDPYGLAVYNNANNIAYWRLNDAAGTVAVDSSKIGGHNATYVGQGTASYNNNILATSGLVAYWHLDETSGTVGNDSKGIAHGVYQGTTVLGQAGIPNNTTTSAKFGPSNYLRIPYASPATDPLRLANGPLTVEAWIKRNALNGQNNGIISTGTDGYYLRINNSNQLQFLRSQIQGVAVSSTTITDTTTWHHVAATKSGATTKLFLDGVELAATVTDATLANSTFPYFYVGAELNGTETFDGWMDEVAVYNVALSPAQIASHYSVGISPPSGFGYPGALSGATDKSVNFDGVDDYIDIPDFVPGVNGAVEAWVKADTWTGSTCLINRRTAGNVGGFSLEIPNDGVPRFHVHNGTAWQAVVSTRTLALGVWNHLVGVWAPGSSLLMVNGEDCGRASFAGSMNNPASPLFRIGYNNAGAQLVDGLIDEVAVYNYSMPDQTIRDHYHLGVKALDAYGLAVDRTPGLISFLRLEEPLGAVFDSSGNGHSGTVGAGVAYGTTGSLFTGDKGLTFSGAATTYVDLSDVTSTLDIAGDITLECWLKVANYANYWMMIINSDAPATRALYEFRTELTTGLPSLCQANGTAWQFNTAVSPAIPPSLNVWNHMVVTRQGNSVQHYLNGVANGPALALTGAVPLAPATNPVKLGARLDSGVNSYPLVGSMDEVAIYNRALTLAEIQEHYNKGISGTWKVSVVGTSPGASTAGAQVTRRRSLAVTSAGVSTAVAAPKARRSLAVTSAGIAVSSAQATRRKSMVVAAAGVSTATGDIGKAIQFRNMVGTSVGIAADIGQTTVRKLLTGTSTATSTAAGQSTRRRSLVVASAGTATETGQPSARRSLVATSSGQTTVSVALTKYKISLVGLAPGVATASVTTIQRKKSVVGVSAGVTTEVGQPTGRRSMVVASAGTSVSSGQPTRRKAMVVASAGVAIATAQIIRKASIVVSAAGKATATGQILIRSSTVPPVTIGGVATVSGFIGRKRQITAASAGMATNTAVATRKRALLATSAGVAATGVTIQRKRPLTASATGIATTTATAIYRYRTITASAANGIAITSTAFVFRKRALAGVSTCSSTTNRATIGGKRAIAASSNGKALTSGRPINIALILWNGSTFTLAGNHPVVLWDQQEFELQPEEGEENVDYVAYKGSTDQFNPVDL